MTKRLSVPFLYPKIHIKLSILITVYEAVSLSLDSLSVCSCHPSLSLFCPFSLTVSLFFPHGKLNGSTTEILHRYNQLLFFFFFVFCILYYNRRISSLCIIVCCVPHQPNHSFPPLVNAIYNRIIEGGIDCGSLIKAHNRVRKTR